MKWAASAAQQRLTKPRLLALRCTTATLTPPKYSSSNGCAHGTYSFLFTRSLMHSLQQPTDSKAQGVSAGRDCSRRMLHRGLGGSRQQELLSSDERSACRRVLPGGRSTAARSAPTRAELCQPHRMDQPVTHMIFVLKSTTPGILQWGMPVFSGYTAGSVIVGLQAFTTMTRS